LKQSAPSLANAFGVVTMNRDDNLPANHAGIHTAIIAGWLAYIAFHPLISANAADVLFIGDIAWRAMPVVVAASFNDRYRRRSNPAGGVASSRRAWLGRAPGSSDVTRYKI